jgi:hypothetical protein
MIDLPGPSHLIFIPGVLLIGIVIGWVMGSKATREQVEARRKRAKE